MGLFLTIVLALISIPVALFVLGLFSHAALWVIEAKQEADSRADAENIRRQIHGKK